MSAPLFPAGPEADAPALLPVVLMKDEIKRVSFAAGWRAYRGKQLSAAAHNSVNGSGCALYAMFFGGGVGICALGVAPMLTSGSPWLLAPAAAVASSCLAWLTMMSYEIRWALAFNSVHAALDTYPSDMLVAISDTPEVRQCSGTREAAYLLLRERSAALIPAPASLATVLAAPRTLPAPDGSAWCEEGEKL